MKRLLCLLLCGLFVMGISACAMNTPNGESSTQENNEMPYVILVENGEYTLSFKDGYDYKGSNEGSEQELVKCVKFSSMREMVNDINTGNFTPKEMETIGSFWRNEDDKIEICDMSKLYVACYPVAFSRSSVSWYGRTYTFHVAAGDNGPYGFINPMDQEEYENEVNMCKNFGEYVRAEITAVITETERNATVYEYVTGQGRECRVKYYEIDGGDKVLHIRETYALEENSSVPSFMNIYGRMNGKCFNVYISNLLERPSVEWLSEFGLREYVETEVA